MRVIYFWNVYSFVSCENFCFFYILLFIAKTFAFKPVFVFVFVYRGLPSPPDRIFVVFVFYEFYCEWGGRGGGGVGFLIKIFK
jgi:hypothetical protein